MNTKLCLAVIAASLAVAPVAMAQQTYENDASKAPPSASSTSSGRTDSPVVKSLPGVDPEPWRDNNQARTTDRPMDRSAINQDGTHHDRMHRDKAQKRAMSGSTGATMDRDVTGSSSRSSMRSTTVNNGDMSTRRGRGQNDLELSQTSLLNQFSAAGYTMVRDFRKDGDRYTAQAQDKNGRWTSVELDPRTSTITPR
ncbi:hypothetical protein ACIU1J_05930 [Azospirillum doebereinerae]|uniref:hypothetical protein n=1 Tax=Azospirillum doebereinerae TaxID=92933 RepID=UPI001EE61B8D|nr:hypothetical protein [Azospirillum doebereinerae]MCG5239754.1 hypothetical protein [Azospirillum doebereinerae]